MEALKSSLEKVWIKIPLSLLIGLLTAGGGVFGLKYLSSSEKVEAKTPDVYVYRLGKIEEKQKYLDEQIYQALSQMKTDIAVMKKDIEFLKEAKQ